jgi:very-short-patch-repair endonuclease
MLIWFALLMFFMYFVDFASASIIAGFLLLVVAMLLETVAYEEIPIREAVFSEGDSDSVTVDKQNEPTPQAKKLHEALNERGVENELEFYDGHKHIDIYILGARLNLEVDGKYHLTDPEFLFRDLQRDLYSHLDGKDTIRIPNSYVDNYLDQIADAIAEVAKRRAKM